MTLDPRIKKILEYDASRGIPSFVSMTPRQARDQTILTQKEWDAKLPKLEELWDVRDLEISQPGSLRVRV